MSEIASQIQYATKAHTFIAKRGALVMKEFSPVGTMYGLYQSKVDVETLVFSSMIGGRTERTYGLKVSVHTSDDGYSREGTCLIDQDELGELINGLGYLEDKLGQLSAGVPNYTEIFYVTKDGFKVGFFLSPGPRPDATLFCSVDGSESAFMPPERLGQLRECICTGQDTLQRLSI